MSLKKAPQSYERDENCVKKILVEPDNSKFIIFQKIKCILLSFFEYWLNIHRKHKTLDECETNSEIQLSNLPFILVSQ